MIACILCNAVTLDVRKTCEVSMICAATFLKLVILGHCLVTDIRAKKKGNGLKLEKKFVILKALCGEKNEGQKLCSKTHKEVTSLEILARAVFRHPAL